MILQGATRVTAWRSVATVAPIAVMFRWFVPTPYPAFAAVPSHKPAGVDAARLARDVLQDERFWWKRIEPRSVSLSWFESPLAALWDSIAPTLRRIADLIAKLLAGVFGATAGRYSGGASVVWLVVFVLVAWSIWKIGPALDGWVRGRRPARISREETTSEMLADGSDLFADAGQAFRDGMHAEAIRLALLSLIASMQEQGLLRHDTTRTNREYQRDLRPRADLAACFGQVAQIYDQVWYGREAASPADAAKAISLCRSVINREDLDPE
jgi:hypothetical protein